MAIPRFRVMLACGAAPWALAACPVAAQSQDAPAPAAATPSQAASPAPTVAAEVNQPATAATDASATSGLGEIVVTAARQSQNLQKVSTAVTVVDGAAIQAQALTNVGQIFSNLPSIQATAQPGGFSIDVRGQGGDLPAGTTQGSVAFVSDGVYNINSQSTTVGFFDINRVEVLAGPQSTRYGPNADGGIVNVITNDPILGKFSGAATLTGGNYDLVRGEIALNLPVTDTLAVRLSGAAVNRSSYFHPAEGNNKAQSFRGKVLWKPTDRLSLKLTYQLDHIGGTGNGSNVFPVYTNKVPVYANDSINDLKDPWGQSPSDPVNKNSANIFQHTIIGNATYDFSDAIALDLLGSYSKITGGETGTIYLPPWSTSTAGGPVIQGASLNEFMPFHQFTAEARLHSGAGSPIKWNLGFYHWNYLEQYSLTNASFLNFPPIKTTTATNAVYGEATYPVTDSLRVIAGARESFDRRTRNFNASGVVTQSFGINFSHFDYRGGLEYDVTPRSMLYFTASSGYRPGGISAYNPVTQDLSTFKSEVNRAYELGLKNRFFDNRLQVNASVFYYDQSNYQNIDSYTGFIPPEGGSACGSGDTRVGCLTPTFGLKAHTLGAEAQIRASISRDDVVSLTGTYLHAVFNKKQNGCASVAVPAGFTCADGYNGQSATDSGAPLFFELSGAVQPHSPSFAATFDYHHTFRLASGARIVAGGDGFYSSGYWVNPVQDATRYGYQSKYFLGNVNVTFTPANSRYSITGWVRNVADYAVKQSVLPAQSIGDPRTFGGTIGYHW